MNEKKNKGKIIAAVAIAVAIFIVAFFSGFVTARLSRSRDVKSFEWALKTIKENYYQDIPDDSYLDGSLKGFAALYLDRYSTYYTKEEFLELMAESGGSMEGVGVAYVYLTDEDKHPQGKSGVLIEQVVGNSPAYKSGLRAGEFISSVSDSKGTYEIEGQNWFSDFIDGKSVGEEFTLISDHGEYKVSKQAYSASFCYMSTKTKRWNVEYENNARNIVQTDEGISCLPNGAAYLRLDQFYGNAADEMAELIEKFNAEHCDSLILDLRGNGGGYVDVMCSMSNIFTGQLQNSNPIAMQAIYKNGKVESFAVDKKYSKNAQLEQEIKVSVLADNGTASASEALIGVLVDNGVIDYGDIYISDFSKAYLDFTGTADKNCRSYGKGIMQSMFVHPLTGEALKLTTAKIYWPKGETSIHDVGLNTKQGCKTVKADWDVTYGDPQLALAVDLIYAN
ncbi:MAG: hypothetical protein K2N14_03290 [Clostridia bacterium]|nr:hypothetical protein [Clostridia bacterium]